jgi:hypothetical protein
MDAAFKKYMLAQIHKIEADKWNEGVKIQDDPGVEYIIKWIRENGEEFKKLWAKSLCKNCIYCNDCGYKVLEICDKHK